MSEINRIEIQHILVSFDDTPVQAQRTKDEAKVIASNLLEQAKAAEDFAAMVLEHSDDPVREGDPSPGVYRLLNTGIEGEDFGAFVTALNAEAEAKQKELTTKIEDGEMTVADAEKVMQVFIEDLRARGDAKQATIEHPRAAMVPAFGDVGFALEVGDVGMADYDAEKSPFGWHIIKRLA